MTLFDFHTLQDVAENFSIAELLELARQDTLSEWLNFNFYAAEADKILAAVENNDADLKLLICQIFNVTPENLTAAESEEIAGIVAKNQRKMLFFDKTANSAFVESQAELVSALHDGKKTIYLYGGEFHIPVNLRDVTYIGRRDAIIDLNSEIDVDFDAQNIVLQDLQIFISHKINITAEKSTNIKILNGSKKSNAIRPTLTEILEILRGRGAFESKANFNKRAENIQGVAIGVALLNDSDYDIDAERFFLKPQWNLEFISVVKNFALGKRFFVELTPENAELIYTSERKLQIFADFTGAGDFPTILNLYFETARLGRIAILWEDLLKTSFYGSAIGGRLGYGLELITDYEEN